MDARFKVGDQVSAKYGRYDWGNGRVKTVNDDGTYGVQFDDGRFFGKADVQDRNEAAQTLFQAADTDSSGTIEFGEFVAMPVNQGKTKEELRALFDSFDLDGNGTLDLQEFHKYMSREQHPAKKLEHVSSTVLGKGGK